MKSGIYLIKNIINGKEYIGSSKSLKRREYSHWALLKTGKHINPSLQNAYNKYGKQAFVFVVVEYCAEQYLDEREVWWTDLLDCMVPKGYMLVKGNRKEVSQETRDRLSIALKGRKISPEWAQKMSMSKKGQPGTFRGKQHTADTKARLAAAGVGNENGKGWQPTLEQREKMSVAKLANPTRISRAASEAAWKANSKTWEVVSPTGHAMIITNLSKFCRENNLHQGNMVQVSKGRLSHYRGWKVRQLVYNQKA